MKRKTFVWIVFAILALSAGVYPLTYYIIDMHSKGLWASKTNELIANTVWHTAFLAFVGVVTNKPLNSLLSVIMSNDSKLINSCFIEFGR